jgi:hypothetical protein
MERRLAVDVDGTTAYYTLREEVETRQFYVLDYGGGDSPEAAVQDCEMRTGWPGPGNAVGDVECPWSGGSAFCVRCCAPRRFRNRQGESTPQESDGVPVHTLDLSTLGLVPPFGYAR